MSSIQPKLKEKYRKRTHSHPSLFPMNSNYLRNNKLKTNKYDLKNRQPFNDDDVSLKKEVNNSCFIMLHDPVTLCHVLVVV